MDKTYFEEVPLAVVKSIAERESLSQNQGAGKRDWKVIAAELVKEQDPNKLIILAQELNVALESETKPHLSATK